MNLIICTTPFQVLVAKKIIDMYPNDEFYGVMIINVNNEKYHYYAELLRHKCKFFKKILPSKMKKLMEIILLIFYIKISKKEINKIFVASIDNLFIQSIISNVNFNKVYSFDDGTANIVGTGFYYDIQIFNLKQKIIRFLLNCQYTVQSLKYELIECHYTVYRDMPNIVDSVQYIDLFPTKCNCNVEQLGLKVDDKIVSIFIGQPIYEMDKTQQYTMSKHCVFVNSLMKELNIDFFIPHPRESNYLEEQKLYVDTEKIFEDYFFEIYDPTVQYRVYTFFSGSVLSIKNLPNVEVTLIKIKNFPTNLDDLYEVILKFNTAIIEVSL